MMKFLSRMFGGKAGVTRPTRKAQLALEVLEDRNVPASLLPGGIVSGAIASSSEVQSWTFSGHPGDKIELITTSTPTQSGFSAFSDVYAPSGSRITGFWAGNNVVLTLEEEGDYTVQVRDDNFTETGSYTIGLEGLKPISPAPSAVVKGGIVSGDITARTEKDQWAFTGNAGDRIQLITTSTATQSGFSAFTDLYAPSGTRVTGFWAGNNVELTLPETGTYMLQVRDDNYVETGKYTIGFEGLKPLSPGSTSLVKGGIVSGTIALRTEKDQWTFTGNAGDRIQLISTSTATESGFSAFTDVYAPSGSRITGFWAGNNVEFTLPETGTYMLQVRDDNYFETGKYTIGLETLKPFSPDSKALHRNVTVKGKIAQPTEKDQWRIKVPAGKSLKVTLSGKGIDAGFAVFANLYDSSGSRVGGMWGGTQTFTLSHPGIYVLQISDASLFWRGTYKVRMKLVRAGH